MTNLLILIVLGTTLNISLSLEHGEISRVINGTLIIGERNETRNGVIAFKSTSLDPLIKTTSAVHSYDHETKTIVSTGNLFPPDTLIRCNVGCQPDLIRLVKFCHRVIPPDCIQMESNKPVVYNVTSSSWYFDTSLSKPKLLYTTYFIVY